MGYKTEFVGTLTVNPPLNSDEIAYLKKFNRTPRLRYPGGPYVVNTSGGIQGWGAPPLTQPGKWCPWIPTDDGTGLEWDGVENPENGPDWMRYLINVFLCEESILCNEITDDTYPDRWYAREFANFTFNHDVFGAVEAIGEDPGDHWWLVVVNNFVHVKNVAPAAGHWIPIDLGGDVTPTADVEKQTVPDGLADVIKDALSWMDDEAERNEIFAKIDAAITDGTAGTTVTPPNADRVNTEEAVAQNIRDFYNGGVAPLPEGVAPDEDVDEVATQMIPVTAAAFASAINDPLTDSEIKALNAALASHTYPTYRRRVQFWNIWSNKHQLWWGPNRHGYFHHQAEAGMYTTRDAIEIMNDHLKGSILGQNGFIPDVILIPAERK